ncbi:hypothetical protein ABIF90_005776 [Bradyrhizobium japonicum]
MVVAKAVRSASAVPGIEMCTSRIARPAVGDRLKQARDEIAMHRAGVAAGTILEHAKTVHDDVDGMLAEEAHQRGCVERQDRLLDVPCAHLLRGRQAACDADHAKSPHAQIVGDEAPDQAGGAEHQNGWLGHRISQNGFAIISHRINIVAPKPGKPNANQRR